MSADVYILIYLCICVAGLAFYATYLVSNKKIKKSE